MTDILIVDDEPAVSTALRKMLENNGYLCETASNASEARSLLAVFNFKLIISDVRMPDESGLELVRSIKDRYPQLAMVVMTAEHDRQIANAFFRAGIYGYILKPYSKHQMLITIQNALIRRNLETEAAHMRENLEETIRQRTTDLRATLHDLEKERIKTATSARHLHDQLLFMKTLLEAMPNPVYYKDIEGKFIGCNRAFEETLGVQRDDIIDTTVEQLLPVDEVSVHVKYDEMVFNTGKKQVYEAPFRFADAKMHRVEFYKAAYKNTQDRIDGLVCIMVDVTERYQQEHALRISRKKLRQIIDHIGIGIFVTDPDMHILEFNSKMKEWFPHIDTDNDIHCYETFHNPPTTKACDKCPALKTLRECVTNEIVTKACSNKGPGTYRIKTTPICNENNEVIAIVNLMEDITDRLNMEQELMHAQKMASIGQLAAGVAHEINNPTGFVSSNLNTLDGYVEDLEQLLDKYNDLKQFLKKANASDTEQTIPALIEAIEAVEQELDIDYIRNDTRTLIGECRTGTDRIKKIVEDLKHFAHPGQNKVQDTDVNQALETTLNVVNNELKYKAKIIKQLGDLPLVSANPQQLNQVFVNLLVNAAQAIEKMGEIRISTCHSEGYAIIQISDTGCGIPPENINKIFDPFFTTKEVGKGTGLGMNIVYNIIKKHNGDIELESTVGVGTTFTIKLPIQHSEVSNAA